MDLPADTAQRPLLVLAAFCVAGASLLVQGGTLGLVVRTLGVEDYRALRRAVLDDQREALLEVRRDGTHDSAVLGLALARLDAIDVSVSREPLPTRGSGDLGPS